MSDAWTHERTVNECTHEGLSAELTELTSFADRSSARTRFLLHFFSWAMRGRGEGD